MPGNFRIAERQTAGPQWSGGETSSVCRHMVPDYLRDLYKSFGNRRATLHTSRRHFGACLSMLPELRDDFVKFSDATQFCGVL